VLNGVVRMATATNLSMKIRASVDRVWQAWIESQELRRWLSEETVVDLNRRCYELYWEPDRPAGITDLVPRHVLEVSRKGPVEFANLMDNERFSRG